MTKSKKPEFRPNDFVVYPAHGVGKIISIEEQQIAGIQLELFVISFEKDKMTLRVPTHKAIDIGMRALSAPDVVTKALDTLKGKGPFTVFAPTDEAFAKLPAGTVETLLKPENKEDLVAVLTYHVVAGKVMAADVVKLKSAETLLGQPVKIDATDGVRINDAKVIKADIECGNGVIHVIDAVLLPKS